MLSKNNRIPRLEIKYLLDKGEKYSSKFFICRYQKNREQFLRFCVIISKKIDKSAVKRNRLRRQIYEAIRLNLKENQDVPIEKSDIALILKKSVQEKDFAAFKDDIKNIISKIDQNNGKIQ